MEQQQRGVKVVEACLVAPAQGKISSSTPTSLTLTYFDLLCLRYEPIKHLFFYEFPHPKASFFDSIVPNLKHSLELTLQQFLPLSGNITWPLHSPYPIINYVPGDDAVPFTIAESNSNNFNILCSNLCETIERHPLIPHLNISNEKASLLAIQVTLFPNTGFCIGITTNHAAVDGNSTALFIRAWGYTCSKLIESPSSLSSLPQNLTPFFDRSVIRDSTTFPEVGGPDNRSLIRWERNKTIKAETVKGFFELTPSHIQILKQYAQSKLKMKVRLSTFSVSCALVLTCLVKAEQPKTKRVAFVIYVDSRSRLDPPIVPTYFGNCVGGLVAVNETTDLLGNNGFINALKGIIKALSCVKDAVPTPVDSWLPRLQPFVEDKMVSLYGSPRFEVYSADFGWGRPKNVDQPGIDHMEEFSFTESRNNNGGFEVCLTLKKKEMEAFADHFARTLKSF